MSKSLFALVVFFWVALHTSQSVMDLADFFLLVSAFWLAFKSHDIPKMLKSFRPWQLWPIWFLVIILGFIFGAPVEFNTAAKLVWEFRWSLSLIAFIYLFGKLRWDEIQFRTLTTSLFLLCILDVVLFFVDYNRDPRAGGLFGHSMPFAHTMGPSALFLLFVGLRRVFDKSQKIGWRGIYLATPILATSLVVLSLTRGVWIGFAVGLLAATAVLGRKVFVSAILILAVVAGGLFVGSSKIQDRVIGKSKESQSNNERLLYWKANLKIFRDYPIVGIGYSQNNVHVEEYLKQDGVEWLQGGHAHNQYIHFLAGTGILGLTCFLFFLTALFWPIVRYLVSDASKKNDHYLLALGCFSGMVCFVVGAFTESNFSIAKNRFMFLFIAAIAYAVARSESRVRNLRTDR